MKKNKNPHKLTLNQHIFPVKSLKYFCKKDGRLVVCDKKNGRVLDQLKPTDNFFGTTETTRITLQHTEEIYGKEKEDKFQNITENIINNSSYVLTKEDKLQITDFFYLWEDRAKLKKNSNIKHEETLHQIDVPDKGTDEYAQFKEITDQFERMNGSKVLMATPLNKTAAFGSSVIAQCNLCGRRQSTTGLPVGE